MKRLFLLLPFLFGAGEIRVDPAGQDIQVNTARSDIQTGGLNKQLVFYSPLTSGYLKATLASDRTSNDNHATANVGGVSYGATGVTLTAGGIRYVDDDALSFGDGSSDDALTFAMWVNAADITGKQLVTKGTYNSDGEYAFTIDSSDRLTLFLMDESVVNCLIAFRATSDPLTSYEGSWVHVAVTYDGNGWSGGSPGIQHYINGSAVTTTNLGSVNGAAYVAMENLGALFRIGMSDSEAITSTGLLFDGRMYRRALSADEMADLAAGRHP
jgi:hypothetical protein